ncbi:MAG: hypothetical protein KAY37_16045, partial [Phycisphaerae bacterium]|nr:hypothetical protein [Phycisphaerae bacterium]
MPQDKPAQPLKVACDAMCGGVARWLRVLGVDATYTAGIEDGELVEHALAENRVIVSADGKLFERRLFTTGRLRGVQLPVGLKLLKQLHFVVRELDISPGFPRCSLCNGELVAVRRAEIGDVVPARSLIWAREFYRCQRCEHVFWEGTHWRRIRAVRERLACKPRDQLPSGGRGSCQAA